MCENRHGLCIRKINYNLNLNYVPTDFICQLCSVATCNLAKRIAEHQGVSERTGKVRGSAPYSSIREHYVKEHHEPPDVTNFKIIGRTRNKFDLGILEAILISMHKPSLNKQLQHEYLLTL